MKRNGQANTNTIFQERTIDNVTTGSDWRQYEPMYNEIDFHNLFYNYFAEPGYYIYMLIFKFMHFSFWNFFILTKVIIFFLCARIINEYVPEFRFLVWMFFLPWFGFYLFIDNPMRNLIAVAIFLYASRYIINRSFLKYCQSTRIHIKCTCTDYTKVTIYAVEGLNKKQDKVVWKQYIKSYHHF